MAEIQAKRGFRQSLERTLELLAGTAGALSVVHVLDANPASEFLPASVVSGAWTEMYSNELSSSSSSAAIKPGSSDSRNADSSTARTPRPASSASPRRKSPSARAPVESRRIASEHSISLGCSGQLFIAAKEQLRRCGLKFSTDHARFFEHVVPDRIVHAELLQTFALEGAAPFTQNPIAFKDLGLFEDPAWPGAVTGADRAPPARSHAHARHVSQGQPRRVGQPRTCTTALPVSDRPVRVRQPSPGHGSIRPARSRPLQRPGRNQRTI